MQKNFDKADPFVSRIILAILLAMVITFLFNTSQILEAFELQVFDYQIKLRGEITPKDDVILITIDDDTIDEMGWPLPRRFYGELVTKLNNAGAKVIVFDLLFNSRTNQIDDSTLVFSIEKAKNVINAISLEVWDGEQNYNPQFQGSLNNPYAKYSVKINDETIPELYNASTGFFPHDDFLDFFDKAGHCTLIQDSDGHFRDIAMLVHFDGHIYPVLGLVALIKYKNFSFDSLHLQKNFWNTQLVIQNENSEIKIPVDTKGRMILNYYGDFDSFPQYTLSDILSSPIPTNYFKDKIIIVGNTATGEKDTYSTPFSSDFPGVGVQATLIRNILDNNSIKESPFIINLLYASLISILVLLLFSRNISFKNAYFPVYGLLILLIIIFTSSFLLLRFANIWIKSLPPGFTAIFSYIVFSIIIKNNKFDKVKVESQATTCENEMIEEIVVDRSKPTVLSSVSENESIGEFKAIEIFTLEPYIILEGEYGKTEKIQFRKQQMTLLYYLCLERLSSTQERWISDNEIKKKEEAEKAGNIYGYGGTLGYDPTTGKPEHAYNIISRLASEINNITKCYNNDLLIRTPGKRLRDGTYYLTESIEKVVIHEN